MTDFPIAVVTSDEGLGARLRLLLEFVGESLVEGDASLYVLGASEDGSYPQLPDGDAPRIYVGAKQPADGPSTVGWLREPFDISALQAVLHRGYSVLRHRLAGSGADALKFPAVIGASEAMVAVRTLMAKVAGNDATVLITGESGTGKEVVARAIHDASRRCAGPFVPVNCGAIPAELLESELFGYERGAFTGAVSDKPGRFEMAAGGTLFLDEIGDMPLPMQVKVLRAIQDRSFERVGGTRTRRADVRIIAATHQDLEAMIAAGTFREDLYYRLNVFPIALPPLRQRSSDIPILVAAVCERISRDQGLRARLTLDALEVLKSYAFPGNVRELKNLMERLSIEFPNELVSVRDLPERFRMGAAPRIAETIAQPAETAPQGRLPINGMDLKAYLADLERSLIEQALEDSNSVVAHAADRLQVRRTTLVEKMRKYGIERGAAS